LRHLDPSSTEVALRVEKLCENICKALQQPWLSPQECQEAEARRVAEEERRRQEKLQEEARQQAEEERRREEAQTKRRLDEAEAEKRRQDKERRKLEKEAAWTAKKAQALHRWRETAAAVVVVLLLVGGIWLYRTTTPAGVTSAVVQPDPPRPDKAKAAADAEAQRKAEEAEQQRLAAVRAEEERKAKAAADEARAKAEQAEKERLAAAKAAEERRKQAEAQARPRFSITEATAVRGEEYRIIRQVNSEQCSNQCASDNRCKMFAYWNNQICYLFNQNFGTYPTAQSIVGTKSN
jgi:hypothetical protein